MYYQQSQFITTLILAIHAMVYCTDLPMHVDRNVTRQTCGCVDKPTYTTSGLPAQIDLSCAP